MFGLLTAIITLSINYQIGHINVQKEIKANIENEVNDKLEKLRLFINIGEKSLNAILVNPIFQKYLLEIEEGKHKELNDTSQLVENVKNLMRAISMENSHYLQVRFIASDGQEKIKITRRIYDA